MAVSTRVCFMCLLLVAVFSISYQGVSGQGLECATKAVTCTNSLTTTGDKEEICKSVETYFNCIENAMEQCGLGEDTMAKAKEQVTKYKCSAPGLPAVSALCLLMAALFHMLL